MMVVLHYVWLPGGDTKHAIKFPGSGACTSRPKGSMGLAYENFMALATYIYLGMDFSPI
jgi:hypothetical protein